MHERAGSTTNGLAACTWRPARYSRDQLVNDLIDTFPKLIKLVAPAGYGKSTLTRALSEALGVAATVDLSYAQCETDISRLLIEALSRHAGPVRHEQIAEASVMFGADEGAWQSFAVECLRTIEIDVLVFENAEVLVGKQLSWMIGELLLDLPERTTVVLCSRIETGMELGPSESFSRTRVVGAQELSFDRNDIAKLFAELSLQFGDLDAIMRFTRGWPIVVMMLYAIARRGSLRAYLQREHDVADLYGYLASEVYRFLDDDQRAVLEAAAAIPDARESDIAALFPNGDYASTLVALEHETPFLSRENGGRIEVHPAMRQMLAQQGDHDRLLARLYATVDRSDGGIRAAQIALHRKRPDDAATAVAGAAGPFLLATPTPELNQILGALPNQVLYAYPPLWSAAGLSRANEDIVAWIESGRKLFDALRPDAALDVRIGLFSSLAQGYVNRGRFTDTEILIGRFEEASGEDPTAAMMASFWHSVLRSYRGEALDLERFALDYAPLLASAGTRALCEYDIVARSYRLRGNRTAERTTLERAVENARLSGIPVIIGMCLNDAAFGAWLWGEDALFQRCIEELEACQTPMIRPTFAHFLGCVRGRCATTSLGSEKLKTRAHGFLIAASLSKAGRERVHFAHQAVVAADQSSQRYAQVLARLALAFVDRSERDAQLEAAEKIASGTCSDELLQAVISIRGGDATGTMFQSLAKQFGHQGNAVRSRLLVDVVSGSVSIEGCREALRPREAELVAFLAIAGRPVRRDEILRALWPDRGVESAAASFKTYVSRLRRVSGDPDIVVHEAARYRLGAPVLISDATGDSDGPANWKWFTSIGP